MTGVRTMTDREKELRMVWDYIYEAQDHDTEALRQGLLEVLQVLIETERGR